MLMMRIVDVVLISNVSLSRHLLTLKLLFHDYVEPSNQMINLTFQPCNCFSIGHGYIHDFMYGLGADHGGIFNLLQDSAIKLYEHFGGVFQG
jgi:hypothetical protein